ncbi:MAG: ABC transporter permease [Thermoplasmata archaeon]
MVEKKRNPKLESFIITMKIFLRDPGAVFGLVVVMIYILIALIDEFDPGLIGLTDVNSLMPNYYNPSPLPPSSQHIFGTTFPGIDLFQGILKAIRLDIGITFFVVGIGAISGILLGLVSGYFGKWIDEIIMRTTDIFFSIPFLVLAIAIAFFMGRTILIISFALIIIWWPTYARVVRGQVLYIKELAYIEAAKASATKNHRIIFKHILPNTLAPIFVQFSMDLASVALIFATLSFLGFVPTLGGSSSASSGGYIPELGYLSSIGYSYAVVGDWWTIVFPGFALLLFALSMNLVGDGLRDALDPRFRR